LAFFLAYLEEDNLTVSIEFPETDEVKPSAADVLIGAYDVISRIFGQGAVIDAYYRTAHDAMDARAEDDEFLKHVKFFGYDDRK
jgi:hypothetical protein